MESPFSAGAVVYAKDITRVSRFYAAVTGWPVIRAEQGYAVLQSQAFQLVIVAIPAHIAEHIEIASPPVRRENTAIKLCFAVPDIAAARETAARLGGELNGPEREWEFQGTRACDGHDPEGNVIQVRMSARWGRTDPEVHQGR